MIGELTDVTRPVHVEIEPAGFPKGVLVCGCADVVGALVDISAVASSLVVVTDRNVASAQVHFLDSLRSRARGRVVVFTFQPGEYTKNLDTVQRCMSMMAAEACDRDCVVAGFGGGVATDLAAMVASTWMRGVRLVQVPTSLLAMADAAVGGKGAVNLPEGRNLAGCWKFPETILESMDFLETLPGREVMQGLVEILKTGFVSNDSLFCDVESRKGHFDLRHLSNLAFRAATAKVGVVVRDPLDSGVRRVLNFGHTVGHAVEAAGNLRLPHGQAVAVGMKVESAIAERAGIFSPEVRKRLLGALAAIGVDTSCELDPESIYTFMNRDKKKAGGSVRIAVPEPLVGDASMVACTMYEVSRPLFLECWNA